MRKFLFLILFLFICNSQIANATDIIFQNNTKDQIHIAYLDWAIGHPYKYPWPVNLAAGEVRPGKRWVLENYTDILSDPKNVFLLTWRDRLGTFEISFWLKGGPALVEVYTTKDCIGLAF